MANLPKASPCARDITLLASAARTSTGSGDTIPGIDNYTSADILTDVTAASGTSPTLDIYIQKLLSDNSTWQDVIHFAQITSTGKQIASIVASGNSVAAVQTAALTVNSIKTTLLGKTWRVHYVIGGTNPSFTFAVTGDFFA